MFSLQGMGNLGMGLMMGGGGIGVGGNHGVGSFPHRNSLNGGELAASAYEAARANHYRK